MLLALLLCVAAGVRVLYTRLAVAPRRVLVLGCFLLGR
jgi:hypothetical protein